MKSECFVSPPYPRHARSFFYLKDSHAALNVLKKFVPEQHWQPDFVRYFELTIKFGMWSRNMCHINANAVTWLQNVNYENLAHVERNLDECPRLFFHGLLKDHMEYIRRRCEGKKVADIQYCEENIYLTMLISGYLNKIEFLEGVGFDVVNDPDVHLYEGLTKETLMYDGGSSDVYLIESASHRGFDSVINTLVNAGASLIVVGSNTGEWRARMRADDYVGMRKLIESADLEGLAKKIIFL